MSVGRGHSGGLFVFQSCGRRAGGGVWVAALEAGLLLFWCGVLVGFAASGRVANYLHPLFHGGVWGAGFFLGVLAVLRVIFFRGECSCGEAGFRGHTVRNAGGAVGAGVWLVVPVLVAVLVSPSEFGEGAVRNRGLFFSPDELPVVRDGLGFADRVTLGSAYPGLPGMDADSYLSRTAEGRIRAEILDLILAARDEVLRPDFEGQAVEVVGQFLPSRNEGEDGGRFYLVRVYILCCAADARPLAVVVDGGGETGFAPMSWLKVSGVARFRKSQRGVAVPVIEIEAVEQVGAPERRLGSF